IATAGERDLLEEARGEERRSWRELQHAEPERDAEHESGEIPDDRGGDDPDRMSGLRLEATDRVGFGQGIRVLGLGPQRATDRDDRDDRQQDPELRLHDRRDDAEDRRPLGLVAPETSQSEHQEQDAERIDLAPDDVVEPEDRVEHDHERAKDRQAIADTELAEHRPGEIRDPDVGDDRWDLDQVADATQRLSDRPDEPQTLQVTRRVVVEEVALVEAVQAMRSEIVRPIAERREVRAEARTGKQV